LGDFRLRHTLQERNAPKPVEVNMDKLRMKFSVLKVDFNGPSLDFLGSRKRRTRASKSGIPVAGDRLPVCEQELLQAFAHPVSISLNFLFD